MQQTTALPYIKSTQITCMSFIVGMLVVLSGCHIDDSGGNIFYDVNRTPGVTSVDPANGAIGVEKNAVVSATFSAGIDTATINDTSFTLGDSAGFSVNGVVNFDTATNIATFTPSMNLGVHRTYTATLSAGITHSGGTPITPMNWSFKTIDGVWGTAETIETDFAATSNPRIALGGNGDAIAIWISGTDVYANKHTAASGTWGTEQVISSQNFAKSDPQVAMDSSGNAIAVWSGVQGGNTNIRAAYYNNATLSWGTPTAINVSGGVANNSQVAFDASGNAIVVWLQQNNIYFNRYASSAWEGPQLIESGTGIAYAPQLGVYANGDAIAVWAQYDAMAGYNVVYANYYTAGIGWSGEASIGNSANGYIPQVAVDNDGNAIAVWIEDAAASTYSIWAAHYDALTTNWGSLTELENDVHISTKPQIGVDAQGNGIAIWRTAPTTGVDRLRYKLYTNAGWGTADILDDGTSDSFEPQLAMDVAGNAIVVWRQATNTYYNSMWANRYQFGNGWGAAELLELDDTSSISSPEVAVDTNGNAFATWIQSDGSVDSTWVSRFE